MPATESAILTPARLRLLIPLAVFVVALAIRLVGIGWGLKNDLHNQSYHPDEQDIFSYSQAVDVGHLKFTPGFYNYGTLYLTTLNIASSMTSAYTGGEDPKSADSHWSYIARCNLAGRIISALAGAGTVLVVFLIIRRMSGLLGAVAGTAILAVAPAHVVHSRFQTVDVMAVFFLAASLLFALKLVPEEGVEAPPPKQILKWIVLSGVFAGLSGATKYTGVLGLLSLLVVLFACRKSSFVKEALMGVAAAIGAFVLGCPGVVLDSQAFMRDFSYEMLHTSTGHGLVFEGTANGFLYHLLNLFQGFGTIATLLGFGALAYAAFRRQVWAIAILAFVVPYYILIGRAEVKFMRYTFPLYAGLAVGFGWAIAKGQENKKWGRLAVGAGILAVGGIDGSGLIGTIRFTGYMAGEDPRDAAARYLKDASRSVPMTVVALPEDPWFWSAPLFPNSTLHAPVIIDPVLHLPNPRSTYARKISEMESVTAPRVTYYRNPDGSPTQFDKRLITDIKPDNVTYSSLEYADPERLQGRTDVSDTGKALAAQYKEFLDILNKNYTPDKTFGDDAVMVQDLAYIQPHVVVWKRKTTP